VSGREVRRSLRVTRHRTASRLAFDLVEQLARRYYRLGERKPWDQAVKAYLTHGEIHKEPATVAEDRRTLTKRFLPPSIVRYVDEARAEHIELYVAQRKAQKLSAFRINREVRTIRAFFNWCMATPRRWTSENPAREIPMLAEPEGVAARALSDDVLVKLLELLRGTRLEGPALLALNHGLREGELIHLRRDAAELEQHRLWIRHDLLSGWKVKGGRERVVHLNEVTSRWLGRYLAQPTSDLCPYLFTMGGGRRWTREALVMAMGRVMRAIGIRRGGFHMLRHSWATRQAEAGTPMPVLKAMGGWRDWRSMEKYQHISDEAERQAAERVVIGPLPSKVIPLRLR